jgi:hypothetical protein
MLQVDGRQQEKKTSFLLNKLRREAEIFLKVDEKSLSQLLK